MSNRAMSWAIDVAGLPFPTKGILMLLADCHNGSSGQCNPSLDWMQDKTGLKPRQIMNHLAKLEAAGLIERETTSHGRARGKSVFYHLKIGILGAASEPEKEQDEDGLDLQDNAGAIKCTCNKLPLHVHDIACALYKEEPEENRNSKPDFEEAWVLYKSSPLKANQTKKLAKAEWARAIKKAQPDLILKAIGQEVRDRTQPEGFVAPLPDMHRWLKNERWNDVEFKTDPKAAPVIDDWKKAARAYCDLNVWPVTLGPAPHEPECLAPVGILKGILKALGETDRRYLNIQRNTRKAA